MVKVNELLSIILAMEDENQHVLNAIDTFFDIPVETGCVYRTGRSFTRAHHKTRQAVTPAPKEGVEGAVLI